MELEWRLGMCSEKVHQGLICAIQWLTFRCLLGDTHVCLGPFSGKLTSMHP